MPSLEEITVTTITRTAGAAGTAFSYAFITCKTKAINALCIFLPLILTTARCGRYYCYPRFTFEEIKWLFIVLVTCYYITN